MSQNSPTIPGDGVSKKLKAFVIILTVLTLVAFVALFARFINKPLVPTKNMPAVQESISNQSLIDEYQTVGTRLMNSGLKGQAIDQFIKVWELLKVDRKERANAAQTVGRLYADLDNCREALVWLFRAEISSSDQTMTPLIDACLEKVRSISHEQ
jgi:hypothetical protein